MTNLSQTVVSEAAFLTLHYRLANMAGEDIITTFKDNPATLQLGQGQLAPFLESCLIGLEEGAHRNFVLQPEQAFGPRNPELLRRVSKQTLAENSDPDAQYAVGDMIEFAAPGGGRFAGVLREMGESDMLFDFNHPLAGQELQFEVRIVSIL